MDGAAYIGEKANLTIVVVRADSRKAYLMGFAIGPRNNCFDSGAAMWLAEWSSRVPLLVDGSGHTFLPVFLPMVRLSFMIGPVIRRRDCGSRWIPRSPWTSAMMNGKLLLSRASSRMNEHESDEATGYIVWLNRTVLGIGTITVLEIMDDNDDCIREVVTDFEVWIESHPNFGYFVLYYSGPIAHCRRQASWTRCAHRETQQMLFHSW